jgi:hypothetical protein
VGFEVRMLYCKYATVELVFLISTFYPKKHVTKFSEILVVDPASDPEVKKHRIPDPQHMLPHSLMANSLTIPLLNG